MLHRQQPRAVATLVSSLAFAACLSCGEITLPTDLGPVPDLAFTTDATGYLAPEFERIWDQPRYRFRIIARFANKGPSSLYLARCYPNSTSPIYGLARTDSLRGGSGFNAPWACVGVSHMLEVAPGTTRVDTLTITGPNGFAGGTHEPIDGPLAGRYRLVYDVRAADGEIAPNAPIGTGASNEFLVRLGR